MRDSSSRVGVRYRRQQTQQQRQVVYDSSDDEGDDAIVDEESEAGVSTTKMFAIFAIIAACFALIYPKFFHPLFFGGGSDRANVRDDMSDHPKYRGGSGAGDGPARPPHPGFHGSMHSSDGGGSKGGGGSRGGSMVSMVLPVYAIGIVLYLLYTLFKVFGKSEQRNGTTSIRSKKNIKIASKIRELRGDGINPLMRGQELERLLTKADDDTISGEELSLLQARLTETENQLTRILAAVKGVEGKARPLFDETAAAELSATIEEVDANEMRNGSDGEEEIPHVPDVDDSNGVLPCQVEEEIEERRVPSPHSPPAEAAVVADEEEEEFVATAPRRRRRKKNKRSQQSTHDDD